jgi:hypothetical protein
MAKGRGIQGNGRDEVAVVHQNASHASLIRPELGELLSAFSWWPEGLRWASAEVRQLKAPAAQGGAPPIVV